MSKRVVLLVYLLVSVFYSGQEVDSIKTADIKEVVVIGYGSQRKELVSGSYATIKSAEVVKNSPVRLEDAMQGKVAGVQVVQNSGAPGAGGSIRIRGITTNGDNRPLIIVDGNPFGNDLSLIDPNNIETINIIKDASTAIYGVQGANGVIIVTTKSGRKNQKPQYSYDANFGYAEVANKIKVMNAQEYAAYINEAEVAAGNPVVYEDPMVFGKGSNWQNQIFEPAPQMQHSLRVRGGGDNTAYAVGLGYLENFGTAGGDKSFFKRMNFDNNFTVDLSKKLKLSLVANYFNNKSSGISAGGLGSVTFNALNMSPVITVYDGRGDYSLAQGLGAEIINPLAQIANTFNKNQVNRLSFTPSLEFSILRNLKATTRFSTNFALEEGRFFSPAAYYGNGKVQNVGGSASGDDILLDFTKNSITETKNKYFDYTWDTFLNYDFRIADHSFATTLGSAFHSEQGHIVGATGFNVPYNSWDLAYLANADNTADTRSSYSGNWDIRTYSFFGRMQYDYLGKYLLTAILRRDASNKFGPGNDVGYFPSVSAGWVVSKENFFKTNVVNYLKLRGSWGITGNDKIDSYQYLSQLGNNGYYVFNDNLVPGVGVGVIPNTQIHWEENFQTNLGVDMRIFSNRLELTTDYFDKKTDDLLLRPRLSGLLGAAAPGSGAPFINLGTIRNSGLEFGATWRDEIGEDFDYNINYNVTYLKNEAVSVNTESGFTADGAFNLSYNTSRFEAGYPIGHFYGFVTDGIYQNMSEINNSAHLANTLPGDLRYKDINEDGIINELDQTDLGSPIPDYTMGLTLGFNYKAFDFSTSAYASIGNEVARAYERFVPYANRLSYYLDRWTGEGTSTEVPRATNGVNNNARFSDFYVEDGSFLRLANAQIGYSLPESVLNELKITKLRVFFSVNNIYTFTNYMGYDPEISIAAPTNAGVDYGQYPRSRTFLTGVGITF